MSMAEPRQRKGISIDFHTTLLRLMIVGGISSCLANSETMPWWTDPCRQKLPPIMDKLRHGRSADNRGIIRDQLNLLITENKVYLNELSELYSKSKEAVKVPRGCKWLNVTKLIKDIESSKGYYGKLRKLHHSLQLFGGILQKLFEVQLISHGKFNKTKRDIIIRNNQIRLKAFICAVKEVLIYANKKTKDLLLKDMNINIPVNANLTRMYLLDVNIFQKMKLFLRKVERKILRRKRRVKKGRNRVRNGRNGARNGRNMVEIIIPTKRD